MCMRVVFDPCSPINIFYLICSEPVLRCPQIQFKGKSLRMCPPVTAWMKAISLGPMTSPPPPHTQARALRDDDQLHNKSDYKNMERKRKSKHL